MKQIITTVFVIILILYAGEARAGYHSADHNPPDFHISLSELLRVIQLYNSGSFHCAPDTEDGYAPGSKDRACTPHNSDYAPQDWHISLNGLLRLIQLYNSDGYHAEAGTEDGFAPGRRTSPDIPPEITLTVPAFLELTQGESGEVGFTVEFRTYDTDDYTLAVSQTISPDSAGISLSAEFPPEWTGDDTGTWILSQRITGNIPGMYEITTVITVPETGVSDQGTTAVSVVGKSDDILGSLGLSPSAIPISEATDVVFRVRLKDPDKKPTEITVEETDESGSPFRVLGHLANDGTSGDLLAGDYVYSGTFNVVSDTEGAAVFRAKAIFPDVPEAVYTDIRRLVVTRFPIGIAPSDTSKIVTDPDTGHRLLSNEVSVLFAEGTDPDTIEAIAGAVGGTVVGMSYGGFCQIRFPGTGDAAGVYNVMDILRGFPEVEITEPYFMDGEIGLFPPSTLGRGRHDSGSHLRAHCHSDAESRRCIGSPYQQYQSRRGRQMGESDR